MQPPDSDTEEDDFEAAGNVSLLLPTDSAPVATCSFHSVLPTPTPGAGGAAAPHVSAADAAAPPVDVRFCAHRLGVQFSETRLGDVVVLAIEPHSEAAGVIQPGMVIEAVAGSRLARSAPIETVLALLKQKSSRPLTLTFHSRVRRADMPAHQQTKLQRPPAAAGAAAAPARLLLPVAPTKKPRKAGGGALGAGMALCGRPPNAASGESRPAGVARDEWRLALDASDLLGRRRLFNRWKEKYVTALMSEVFAAKWCHRLLLRAMEQWASAVEEALTTAWLLNLTLSRWRNRHAHRAFARWVSSVGDARPSGFCAEFLELDREERRERALEEPAWHVDSRVEQAQREAETTVRRERLDSVNPRGAGAAVAAAGSKAGHPEPEPEQHLGIAGGGSDSEATDTDGEDGDCTGGDATVIDRANSGGAAAAAGAAVAAEEKARKEGLWGTSNGLPKTASGDGAAERAARIERGLNAAAAKRARRIGTGSVGVFPLVAVAPQGWFASLFASVPCCAAPA